MRSDAITLGRDVARVQHALFQRITDAVAQDPHAEDEYLNAVARVMIDFFVIQPRTFEDQAAFLIRRFSEEEAEVDHLWPRKQCPEAL